MPSGLLRRSVLTLLIAAAALPTFGCGGPKDAVADEESARRAYLGLDRAIDRMIDLGFAGFSAADSANIPEQSEMGDLSGLMVITGKVDQGASNNKNMTLSVVLSGDYSDAVPEDDVEDPVDVVYNGGPGTLQVSFKGLPNATMENSSYKGTYDMTGDLAGVVTLDLVITGMTEEDASGAIVRKPGTIHVVGTATSDYGVFNVDVAL